MTANPLLKRLGYSDTDRLVIIHADDIGMCWASVQAFKNLWESGTVSSGAVMAPCPWFLAAAEMAKQNPSMDLGIHATLNAEWKTYRWGPVSTRDPKSGLMDAEGYLHRSVEGAAGAASAEAVALEIKAQAEQVLAAGIDATHIDSHMGTIMQPKFIESYLQTAMSHRLPNMLPRASAIGFDTMGVDDATLKAFIPFLNDLEKKGVPMLDGMFSMPLDHDKYHIDVAKQLFHSLPVGITHFIFHPSIDTPELHDICHDWSARVANYNAFMSNELKQFLKDEGIHPIGYRLIRDAMRS